MVTTRRKRLATVTRTSTDISLQRAIVERAAQALRQSTYAPLAALSCDFNNGVLTVTGQVPSFHLKQIVQVALRNIDGVGEIDNRVDVVDPRGR
ncbi:MAG: BON domain-containing protein [Pirellulales bacterium]|nr:BON domain-containing protein [Planctomycetales bacterium]